MDIGKHKKTVIGTKELLLIGAGCVSDTDISQLLNPIDALDVRFHRKGKWTELERLYNRKEMDSINESLRALPNPIGYLFSEKAEQVRLVLVSLIVLRQHFGLAEEGVLLYEKGWLMGRFAEMREEDRYDAEDYYAQCRRGIKKKSDDEPENEKDES